jgi:hypothetical protein
MEMTAVSSAPVINEPLLYGDAAPDADAADGVSAEDDKAPRPAQRAALFSLVGAFIALSIVATIGRKLSVDAFGSHLAFFRQELGNFLYNFWCTAVVLYKMFWTKEIASRDTSIHPLYLFAAIGFLDGLAEFLTSVGGVHSPGSLQTLLGQLIIPVTLGLAVCITRAKFRGSQALGAVVIVLGVCVATVPQFTSGSKTAEGQKTYWYSIVVFAIGQVPAAASVVGKDFLFKKGALDVFYLSCLVSWCQLFISWLFVPLESIHALGGVPMAQIGNVMADGARCFLGERVPKDRPAALALNATQLAAASIEYCRGAYVPAVTLSYSVAGFIQGVLQLYIVKWHSATLAVLCQAVTLPLSNLAYSVPLFFGSDAEPFSPWNVVGLLVTVCGLLLYQSAAIQAWWRSARGAEGNVADDVAVRDDESTASDGDRI